MGVVYEYDVIGVFGVGEEVLWVVVDVDFVFLVDDGGWVEVVGYWVVVVWVLGVFGG